MIPVPSSIILVAAGILVIVLAEFYHVLGRRMVTEPDIETVETVSQVIETGRLVRHRIITHTDFDGFVSGTLLLRLLGKDAAIMFSSPSSLLRNLKAAGTGLMAGDSITIADLAMQPHKEHEFSDVLNDLRNRDIRIIWIDHHEWPAGLVERMESICHDLEVDTSEKTAAALIRRRMDAGDGHAERLLKFVQNRSDEADKEWDRIWRYALAELSHRRDPELSEKLLRSWADNEKAGILRAYLARQGYKREKTTQAIAAHQHRREKTRHDRTFLVIDVRPRRLERDEKGRLLFVLNGPQPGMMVGREACRSQHGDFCLIVWDDFRYSVYRGNDPGVGFENLFGRREIDGVTYRAGGHRYAVSVRVLPTMGQRLRAMFRFKLGP
nr:hypothetical protein [bacterium]